MTHNLIYAKKDPNLINTLLHRRSVPIKLMADPAPSDDEINTILAAAMRTPDHGKLNPWWFITFTGERRTAFGALLKQAWLKREPEATEKRLKEEQNRLMRAPLVIAVISSPRQSAIPVWEQFLSAGAACQNILLAANALGFGANWLTEWYSFDDNVRTALKLDAHEKIAGFMYIGTPLDAPDERPRPEATALINTNFTNTPARGQQYNKDGLGYVLTGMDLSGYSE